MEALVRSQRRRQRRSFRRRRRRRQTKQRTRRRRRVERGEDDASKSVETRVHVMGDGISLIQGVAAGTSHLLRDDIIDPDEPGRFRRVLVHQVVHVKCVAAPNFMDQFWASKRSNGMRTHCDSVTVFFPILLQYKLPRIASSALR